MNRECPRVERVIWDAAQDDAALPEDAARHIDECDRCKRFLEETRRSLALLRCAAPYPLAPDCRAAVVARISRAPSRGRALRLAWAGATALAVLVLALIAPIRLHDTHTPSGTAGTSPAAPDARVQPDATVVAGRAESKSGIRVTADPERDRASAYILPRAPRSAKARGSTPAYSLGRERPVATKPRWATHNRDNSVAIGFDRSDDRHPTRTSTDADDSATLMVVSVEWSARPLYSDFSYSILEEDEVAATATTGSVDRTGNHIEIRMETTPVAVIEPRQGDLTHEKMPAS